LTELSNLKLDNAFPTKDPIDYEVPGSRPGTTLIVHGRPSFTRLRRISVGVLNNANTDASGQLWFDELRAVHIAKDVGTAGRVQVDGKMANLVRYNVSYNERGADFVTVGENRGTGTRTSQLSTNTGFDLHRFFEGTGIVLPITTSYNRSLS